MSQNGWSDAALELFSSRAIDPELASDLGVSEGQGKLYFPHGRYRPFDGHTLSPPGPARGQWWGRKPSDRVLVCEGETDALAALTALRASREALGFHDLPALAIPGSSFPVDRILTGLIRYGVKTAYLPLDADKDTQAAAARRLADNLSHTLRPHGITLIPVEIPEGHDLASYLASDDEVLRPSTMVSLLTDAEEQVKRERQGRSFAEIAAEDTKWLWRQRVPLGELTILGGSPRQGKSSFTRFLAAELSRAGKSVLMANADDSAGKIARKLREQGAALGRIHLVEDGSLVLPNVERLREQVAETGAKLVTIDPYDAFLGDVNQHKRREIYAALKPLRSIARDFDCAVVIVCHLNRSGEEEDPLYLIPVGLRDLGRAVLTMHRGEKVTELRHPKSSDGIEQGILTFTFEEGGVLVEEGADLPSANEVRQLAADAGLLYDD